MNEQTDNQQRKVSETDIAWLGGFIDGEGSIGLKTQKYMRGKGVFYVAPYVQICNTHVPSLERIHRILDGMGTGHYIHWKSPHVVPQGKREASEYLPMWVILISGLKRCKTFLAQMLPYLFVKKTNAERVQEFIASREANYYKHLPYSERELEIISTYRKGRRKGMVTSIGNTEIAQRLHAGNA